MCGAGDRRWPNRILIAGGGGGGAGNLVCNQAGGGGGLTGGSATQNILCSGGGVGGNQNGTTGSGQLGQGGVGADDDGFSGPGGGGGGGYYGGSGGNAGLGGGGGSGFGPAGTAFQTGARSGAGLITIAFGSAPTVTGVTRTSVQHEAASSSVITGTNFVPGTDQRHLRPAAAPQVSCGSTTQCNAVSPAGTGTVEHSRHRQRAAELRHTRRRLHVPRRPDDHLDLPDRRSTGHPHHDRGHELLPVAIGPRW